MKTIFGTSGVWPMPNDHLEKEGPSDSDDKDYKNQF